MKKLEKCRICGNPDLLPVLSLGNQVLTGVFPRSPEDNITCGPLELVKCHGEGTCSLLQLAHSYDSAEMYGANYGYRSGLNRSMVSHLGQKVQKLLAQYPVSPGDIVLDIGSNDGTLLSNYPEGVLPVGMDPTAAKFREYYQPRVTVIPDFFSAEKFLAATGGKKARMVTSIAMLYDLESPLDFVRQIASILENNGVWHFEQSYMPSMIQVNAYDTICHEHLEYYGLRQIQWMLEKNGLKILEVEINDINGGSFAVKRYDVPSYDDPAIEFGLQPPQYYVPRAAQRACRFIRELDRLPHQPPSASLAIAETRLPSAWPATFAIATFITWPVSFGLSAPVSAIAAVTISRS